MHDATRTGDVLLPVRARAGACYDPDRCCEFCGEPIPQNRQENALFIGRYPKYDTQRCAKQAASARWYIARGRDLYKAKKRLNAERRARRKKNK